jgi:outer membrane protein assembly factor BamB
MTGKIRTCALILAVWAASSAWAGAPVGWRNDGTGRFGTATPPSVWSSEKNVLWKVGLPGASYGAPIVVEENLFVVSDPADLLCVRRTDGKILWRKSISDIKAPPANRGPGGFGMGNNLGRPLLKALDADKDGKLDTKELGAGVKKFFKDCDKGNKGKINEKAIAAALNRILPAQGGFGGPGGGRRGGRQGERLAAAIIKRADADDDGMVTAEKLVAAAEKLFKEADKEKKGKLDASAINEGITLLMPQRGFGGGPGGGRGLGGGRGGPGGMGGMSAGNSAATPVSDGKHIAAVFGNGVAAVYTLEGKRLWARLIESPRVGFGHAASPLLLDGKLIVHFKDLVALDVGTGKEAWRVALPASHASPVAGHVGKEEIIISPTGTLLRARDGKVLAKGEFRSTQSSPVQHDDMIFIFGKTVEAHRVSQNDKGEIKVALLWEHDGEGDRHHIPSPLFQDGLLYGATTGGFLEVLDATTGKRVYRQRLGLGQIYSSVTQAGDYLYVFDTRGKAVVFKPGRRFQKVSVNELEGTGSCPVFMGDNLYLRGGKNLYSLSSKAAKPTQKDKE